MAFRLPDGSIQMADGRILYANSVLLAADLLEILPLVTPPPAWPFVSGGGGGGSSGAGTPGARGADGAPGAPGAQGPQGTNPGVQGPQGVAGVQGNQGIAGAGFQGPQGLLGTQGFQGFQGSIGAGVQGPQGLAGVQGNQGNQGAVGSGVQGSQGSIGAQGNQGNQGSGFQGIQGPQGALSTDIFAATRVVSLIAGDGTDLTIAAAIAALPAQGGYIYIKQGTYSITSELSLPDKNIVIRGSGAGTVIQLVGAISAFKIQDGLTERRNFLIENLAVQGDGVSLQTVAQLDDANNFGNFEFNNIEVTDTKRFAFWSQYDPAYLRQSDVFIYNSVLTAISGGSILATTPNPAGSYISPVGMRIDQTQLLSIVDAGVTYAWGADADMDLWVNQGQIAYITTGFAVNGWMTATTAYFVYGTGEITANGNGWDFNDFFLSGEVIAFDPTTLAIVDLRVNLPGTGITDSVFFCGLRCTFIGWVVDCQFLDAVGSAFPAVQLKNQKSIVTGSVFRNASGAAAYPQGAVDLNGAATVRCKIHHNFFEVTLVGPTITETAGANFNIIDGNTGEQNGTGLNITGADSTVNGATKADASAATTGALVAIVPTILNQKGLMGSGTVKNTGVTNSMDVKESFTDAFGTTSSVTTTVAPGNSLLLDLSINLGTGFTPYVSYKVEVIDTVIGNHTTYVSHFTNQGATQ